MSSNPKSKIVPDPSTRFAVIGLRGISKELVDFLDGEHSFLDPDMEREWNIYSPDGHEDYLNDRILETEKKNDDWEDEAEWARYTRIQEELKMIKEVLAKEYASYFRILK